MIKRNIFLLMLATTLSASFTASAQVTPTSQMESLSRGVVALPAQSGGGQFVSWRLLGTDDKNVTFDLLRDGKLLVGNLTNVTNYTDHSGSLSSSYQVVTKLKGSVVSTSEAVTPWSSIYKTLTLDLPPNDGEVTYSPNDCSVGDVDGDGEYEVFVKWDPSNSKDNSQGGVTSNVYIDCYKLDGTKLWRIDLGCNIRAGAHYTQFMVYDFDGDGHAEMMCKTAPGSIDGTGTYVNQAATEAAIKAGDNSKSWANSDGRIDGGHEYLTVFDGESGKAIHTIAYNPTRNAKSELSEAAGSFNWTIGKTDKGSYGNRGERYLAAVAYLDGPDSNPYGIFCRGYYSYAYVWAVGFDGQYLRPKWLHSSGDKSGKSYTLISYDNSGNSSSKTFSNCTPTSGSGSGTMFGNGNHNMSVADVDDDGKDEIVWGSAALDDNGSLLYATGFGHGDAIHLGKMIPDRKGLQVFQVHEEKGTYSWDLHDAATGEIIYKGGNSGVDNGRGLAADLIPTNDGYEFWSSDERSPRSAKTGETVSTSNTSVNFRVYWNGDLQDELLDGTKLDVWNGNGTTRLLSLYEYGNSNSCNSTKATPNLQADLFGDWREEIILWDSSNRQTLNIFTTNIPTGYRVPTLMHDHTYRMGVAWQNTAYNQPPHLGYYLPDYADSFVAVLEQETDNLKDVYTQDYEGESDATSWQYGSIQRGTMSLESDDSKYIKYAVDSKSNAAYTLFDSDDNTSYILQFDAALTPGNTDGSEFHVMSDGGSHEVPNTTYWQSYASFNGNLHSLFNIKFNNSGVGTINYDDESTFSIPSGKWCHYYLTVDGEARTVGYKICDRTSNALLAEGIYQLPTANKVKTKGIYVLNGRYNGAVKVDNIRISVKETPVILGDVNGNGGIDIGDAVSIVNHLVGKKSETFVEEAADVNKNGGIDIGDAVSIVNILVGKTTSQ
jgi:rhamnogalacturonan endolyase